MFKSVDTNLDLARNEENILKFWKEHDIFKKSMDKNKDNEPFIFYEGPPTANGKPHPGHVLGRSIKDVFNRYKSMKGFFVPRKAGWDTHGLPVEIEVEKKLGLDGKQEIENYGIEKFIKHCKESVFTYKEEWEKMTERLGFWVDMDNPYITMDNNYVESIWWALKQIFDKDMLYYGHKILPYCPRCGTALSSHEVAQGYKQAKDPSVFVKFKIKDENTHFLVWTTTPWTLISNIALAVNENETYVKVKVEDDELILAKARLSCLEKDYEIIQEFKGNILVGKEYEQLFEYCKLKNGKNGFIVVKADYVSMDDGTGIVHIAPAFGEDDYQVGVQNNLDFFQPINLEGKFTENVTDFKDMFVKDADPEILYALKTRKLLYRSGKIEHTYPFCWRCDSPLLYYARESWFIKMSSVKDKLLANNKTITWYPDYIQDGRFGNFLENVIDWAISRDRYWGTPLNIWVCEDSACDHKISIGSIAELKEKGIDCPDDIELHKPYVDKVLIKCEKCGKTMKRVNEVIDCWFDSGCMHTAQWHYPFENKEMFDKCMPADFISEGIDQTRGWFYSLLATSTLLYDKAPYKNCVVIGLVQGKDGQKMSKSKGNTVDPWEVFNNQGADAMRWYFCNASAPWVPKAFYPEAITESIQKFLGTLKNVYSFFVLYANIDKYEPGKFKSPETLPLLDKWILSYYNDTIKKVTEEMDNFDITKSSRRIQTFVDDLSNWYLRRSRRRFWASDFTEDKISAYNTLYEILVGLSKLCAPYIPFMAEDMYQNLVRSFNADASESVHMEGFPIYNEKAIDTSLHELIDATIRIVSMGRSARNDSKIKNRQPLNDLTIGGLSSDIESKITLTKDQILEELNIKEVKFTEDNSTFVNFDLKPNFKTLGPKYGKLVNKIRMHLESMSEETRNNIGSKLLKDENVSVSLEGHDISLAAEDVNIMSKGKEDFSVISENELFVALNTHLNDDLVFEGYIREIVNKIQNMRKNNGFEVMDRIDISINGDDIIKNAFDKFGSYLTKETLCDNVIFEQNDNFIYQDWDINGLNLKLGIKKK